MDTVESSLQFSKLFFPAEDTLLAVTPLSPVQFWKALSPMAFTLLRSMGSCSELHPQNM